MRFEGTEKCVATEDHWGATVSIGMIRRAVGEEMLRVAALLGDDDVDDVDDVDKFIHSVNSGAMSSAGVCRTSENFERLIYGLGHAAVCEHFEVLSDGFGEVEFRLLGFEGTIDRRPLFGSGYALDQIHISWKGGGIKLRWLEEVE